jgi:predicted PurR-regulated permease PerM
VLAAQLIFGAMFGIMGLLLADPILATIKTTLEDLARRKGRRGAEPAEPVPLPR